jgi:hypothetical protein
MTGELPIIQSEGKCDARWTMIASRTDGFKDLVMHFKHQQSRDIMYRFFCTLLVLAVLCGCASTGSIKQTQGVTTKLSTYKVVKIETSSAVPDSMPELTQLETSLIAQLRDAVIFQKVFLQASAPELAADLNLKVNINDLKRVGVASRLILGGLAGRATVSVDVTLVDIASGNTLGSFTAEGKSSGGTAFAGLTPQAIDQVAAQIVAQIKTQF